MTDPFRSSSRAGSTDRARESQEPLGEEVRPQEVPAPERPRHLRVVERQPRLWLRRGRLLFAVCSGVVIAVAFGLVYLHVVMAERQFRLDDLSAQLAQEQAQYQSLRLRVAELDSPQQIISTAEGKLGMRQPASVTYLSPPAGIPTSGSGLAGTAAAGRGGVVPAPAGDADWPQIKADLAGSP